MTTVRTHKFFFVVLLGLVIYACFYLVTFDRLPLPNVLIAFSIVALSVAPVMNAFYRYGDLTAELPFVPYLCLFLAFFYGASILYVGSLYSTRDGVSDYYFYGLTLPDAGTIATAQLLAFLGIAFLFAGMFGMRRFVRRRGWSIPFACGEPNNAKVLVWLLMLGHIAHEYLPFVQSQPSVTQLLQPAGTFAIGAFFLMWRRGYLSKAEKLVLLLLVSPVVTFSYVGTLGVTKFAMACIVLLAVYIWDSGKTPWRYLVATAVFVIVAYPLMMSLRGYVWNLQPDTPVSSVVAETSRLAKEHVIQRFEGPFEPLPTAVVQRTCYICLLSVVMDQMENGGVQPWGGKTYKPLLTSVIPRLLAPNKPLETIGFDFGVRYRFIDAGQTKMSLNLPWLVEAHANFGIAGIIFVMGLIGGLLGVLMALLADRADNPISMAVAASVIIPLFNQQSNFSLMTGSLPLLILFYFLYFKYGAWALTSLRRVIGISQ